MNARSFASQSFHQPETIRAFDPPAPLVVIAERFENGKWVEKKLFLAPDGTYQPLVKEVK